MQGRKVFGYGMIGLIALAWYTQDSAPPWRAPARDDCQSEITAFVASQTFVKRQLKAPATAEFPLYNYPGVTILKAGPCTFDVHAYVDAENSFGAKLRNRYFATVEYGGGAWRVVAVTLD